MVTHFCDNCGRDFTNLRCPRCGGPPASTPKEPAPVSVPEDRLDIMIEHASRPTLASLLKQGIKSGLIKPTHDYQQGSTP
jgi:predicted amidophosphoribosyltransferase